MSKSPARLCVGCRQLKPRGELLRLTVDYRSGIVVLNDDIRPSSSTPSGRSAYICAKETCLLKAQKGQRLHKALSGRKGVKKGKDRDNSATLSWPLEPQLIKVIADLCADHGKTCQNTER